MNLVFTKISGLWDSNRPDKFGKPYLQGTIEADIQLRKGDRIFVFRGGPKTKPTSPVGNVSVGQPERIEEPEETMPETQGPAPWDEGQNIQAEDDKKDKEPSTPDDCPF